jgi:hypothetical protein
MNPAPIQRILWHEKIGKFLFAIALLFFSLPLQAQTVGLPTGQAGDLRLTTSPLPINLKTTPGNILTTNLKIKNDGTQAENIKVTLMKFKADGTSGAPMLLDREPGDDFFNWVTFSDPLRQGFSEASPTFTLPVNEWKTITATFSVPTTASFGYYYAVVFSRADEQVQPAERQTVIAGGTATLVLLEVQVPNAKREIQATQFSADKNAYEFLPVSFTVKLQNSGNVHVAPRGNIFISQGDNKNIATLEVNPGQGSLLPDSARIFEQKWSDGFPVYRAKVENGQVVLDANNRQQLELKWDFKDASKLRWGKYTAKLLLVYDDGQKDVPIEGEVSFWVMPWRLVLGGLVVLILALLGLKSTLQGWYKKIKNILGRENK